MNGTAHGVEPMKPATYLTQRVEDQLAYYEKGASKNKKRYVRMQTVIIVLGVLVPVVINIPTGDNATIGLSIRIAATVMSLSLAIVSGLLNFQRFGDLWLQYRMTEELLKHEKFLYLAGAGRYADAPSAFARFVEMVESILSAEHNKFRSLIEDAKRPTAESSQG